MACLLVIQNEIQAVQCDGVVMTTFYYYVLGKPSIWFTKKTLFQNYHIFFWYIKVCRKLCHLIWGLSGTTLEGGWGPPGIWGFRKEDRMRNRQPITNSPLGIKILMWSLGYDGFIDQKILQQWRQESRPFGPGWAADIPRIRSWTSRD